MFFLKPGGCPFIICGRNSWLNCQVLSARKRKIRSGQFFFQQNPEVGYGLTKDESAQVQPKKTTLPETNSLHLTMDAWNTRFVLGWPISGCYVSLPEGRRKVSKAGMISLDDTS